MLDHDQSASPRRWAASLGPALFLVVAIVCAGWLLVGLRGEIGQALQQVHWWSTPVALLVAAAAVLAIFRAWLAIVRDIGLELPTRAGLRVFSIGQVGKYVPGSVWSVVAPAHLARAHGVSSLQTGAATVVALLVSVVVALGLGSLLLPFAGMPDLWFAPAATVILSALLIPRVLNGLAAAGARALRKPLFGRRVSGRGIVRSAAWAGVANACFGVHLLVLGQGLGLAGLADFLLCTAAYALAAACGVLVFLAPAGAGAREGMLVLVLSSGMSVSAALVVALLSRLAVTLAEFGLAGSQVLVRREAR